MYGWLNMHAGRGNFAIHSAPNDLNAITGVDAALFYFMDVSVARAFVERFACGVAVVQTGGAWRLIRSCGARQMLSGSLHKGSMVAPCLLGCWITRLVRYQPKGGCPNCMTPPGCS